MALMGMFGEKIVESNDQKSKPKESDEIQLSESLCSPGGLVQMVMEQKMEENREDARRK